MIAPKLRFSEFKDEWNEKLLSDFTTFSKGKGLSKSDIVKNGKNPCIRYGELYTNYGSTISEAISYTNLDKNNCVLSKKNQIIIPSSGETQIDIATASCVLSDDIILGSDLNILTTNENGIFLAYYLSSAKKNDIAQLAQGNSVVHLYAKELATLKINYPSKEEQTKIAEFLSAVDDKISQLSRQLELLNQYKKGVMQKIFSQEIRFKNDNGEDFGEWEEVKFSDIFIEIKDKVGNKNIETYSITAGKGFVSQSEKFGRDISGSQNENYIVLGKNDFSYNKGNSKTYKFGCVYLNNTGQNIAVPNVFISFRAKKNNIAHNFYAKLFEHHYLDRYLRQLISSSARMDGLLNISKEGFFEIPLPIPPTPEQEKIAEFLTAIDERIDHTTAQLTHTKQWKKGLLQQMFV